MTVNKEGTKFCVFFSSSSNMTKKTMEKFYLRSLASHNCQYCGKGGK